MVPHSIVSTPRATPVAGFERPVDLVHLALQTQGDKSLEAEVLGLFLRQSPQILKAIIGADDDRARFEAAHRLKGSAKAVGAFSIAECAEAIEIAALAGSDSREAMADLSAAVAVTNRYITELLA
jgi:HPt (histidine-containing phosphotransfer) domain-containing protein